MRMRISSAVIAIVALVAAAVSSAATVGVTATVANGSTLSVSSLNTPSFGVTLTGDDQSTSYTSQLQIVDARGLATGGGWNLTVSATQFSDGSGHTLPASAQTIASTTIVGCHTGSTCTTPTNNVNAAGAQIQSGTPTKFFNAANATGLGRIDVNLGVSVSIPANTIAATYTSTLTISAVAGP